MTAYKRFTLVSFIASSTEKEVLDALCHDAKVKHISATRGRDVLETLLEHDVDLIVFHTSVGNEDIVSTLEVIQRDSLSRPIPVVVLSQMSDNEQLAADLSAYMVIAILAYTNWKFQLARLLEFLQSQVRRRHVLNRDLQYSEAQNIIDTLTGTLNRSGVAAKFEQLVSYYQSNKERFSFVMFDIDHFKKINDGYGHDVGDEVLVGVCAKIQSCIGKYDALCRFGGEEFIVFLSDTELAGAKKRAEEFREQISLERFSSCELQLTASFSVVEYRVNETLDSIINRADTLLYRAKNEGRNRVCSAD